MKLKGLAIIAFIVAICALVAAASAPPTPFVIYGYVFYENGTACDNPVVNVTNLNTSVTWLANSQTSSNDYCLILAAGTDLNERDALRFDVSAADGKLLYTTEHTVTPEDINNGGIFNFDFPPIVTAPSLVVYTISNRTITAAQTTEIDVVFSEEVEWTIAVEDSGVVYDWSGTSTNPAPKIWNGTFETNGRAVPDGTYTVKITWINTTTGLSGQNSTETITVSSIKIPVFTDVASEYGVNDSHQGKATVWFDYDNDGDLDLLLTVFNGDYTILYRNDGDTFVDVAEEVCLPAIRGGLSVGDYDNDGDIDILRGRLFRNDIDATDSFTEVGSYGDTFVDYDNDGDLDIYQALHESNKLFRNDGKAGFVEIPGALGTDDSRFGRSAVWGDYDNDGDLDYYLVGSYPGYVMTNRLYQNSNSENGNHWLHIKAIGTISRLFGNLR